MNEPSWKHEPEADETLEENWLFQLRRERFRSRRSGKTHDFFVVHLVDAVHVIALTPQRKIVLVEQFRAGSGRDSLETPGGLIESGEDPLVAGARELLEETGYTGDPPLLLGHCWSNPSLLTSRIATILIQNAVLTAEPKLDSSEEMSVTEFPAGQVPALIRDGRINHSLVIQGLLIWLVSELPCSPFEPIGLRGSTRRRFQFRISTIMAVVLSSALVFATIIQLGLRLSLALAAAISIPISVSMVLGFLEPPEASILLRTHRISPQRILLRLLAILGLFVFVTLGALLLIGRLL